MLKDIKSTYFTAKIFSFIDELLKLKLIKYNKSLQKNMNISIINYKHMSRKYLIYDESTGIGKEYSGNGDTLIFEGEYLNGKRNGKGKEYANANGNLTFEGEYLNGKRTGKGKEYDYLNGSLKFEGEYLNGKRNGKGKEYEDGQFIFVGEYLNDKEWIGTRYGGRICGLTPYKLNNNINGIGKEYQGFSKLLFEGEYLNGKRNGKGKEYHYNGKLEFEGEYKYDIKWNGKGYDPDGKIAYELKDGKGLIKEYSYEAKLEYEGEYLNGKRNGKL